MGLLAGTRCYCPAQAGLELQLHASLPHAERMPGVAAFKQHNITTTSINNSSDPSFTCIEDRQPLWPLACDIRDLTPQLTGDRAT